MNVADASVAERQREMWQDFVEIGEAAREKNIPLNTRFPDQLMTRLDHEKRKEKQ